MKLKLKYHEIPFLMDAHIPYEEPDGPVTHINRWINLDRNYTRVGYRAYDQLVGIPVHSSLITLASLDHWPLLILHLLNGRETRQKTQNWLHTKP